MLVTNAGNVKRAYCSPECRQKAADSRRNEQRRTRRSSKPAAETFNLRELKAQIGDASSDELANHARTPRPVTWGDCSGHTGPCPWVGCAAHTYLDVNQDTGSVKLNFPGLEPEELEHPCSLREADFGGLTLEDVAQRLNLTRERVRQIEAVALRKLKHLTQRPDDELPQYPTDGNRWSSRRGGLP